MRRIALTVHSLGFLALAAWTAQEEYTNPVSCRYAGGRWINVQETREYVCIQPLSNSFRTQLLQTISDMTLDASAPEYCQGIMDHLAGDLAAQVRGGDVWGFYSRGITGGFHNPRYDRNQSSLHYSFNRRDWHTFGPITMFHEAAHHEGYEHNGNPGTYTVTEECLNL